MKKTGVLLFAWFVVSVAFLLGVEAFTLMDTVESNHVTAVVRWAIDKEPGVFIWLSFSLGYLLGHFAWSGRKK